MQRHQNFQQLTLPEAIRAWMEGRPLFGDVRRRAVEALDASFWSAVSRAAR